MDMQAFKTNSEALTAEEYLNLTDNEKKNIEGTVIMPGKLGTRDFGKIKVFYKTPLYKAFYERKSR
jgi:hypothetical protein